MSILGMLGNRPAPSSGGGPTPPASTVIRSVDFSTVGDHDFNTDGTTLALSGVTFTAKDVANSSQFEVDGGLLKINPNSSIGHAGGYDNAPEISASWADLMTAGAASGSFDPAKTYVWRCIFNTAITPVGTGGPICGIATDVAVPNKDLSHQANGGGWRFNKGGSTGSSYTDVYSRTSTGVPGSFRNMAVVYGQGTFAALASSTDTNAGEAFGGVPIWAGYIGPPATNSVGYFYLSGSPYFDLTAVGAKAYVGAWHWGSASMGVIEIASIELHEVG